MEGKAAERLTIDQIARLAFVSRSVVSRVLNNHANVSPDARRRVQEVIDRYHYAPSAAARSLVTKCSHEVTALVPRLNDEVLANGFWPLLLQGVTEGCNRRGYLVSLSMIAGETSAAFRRRILDGRHFDGYLVVTSEVLGLVLPSLVERQIPVMLVGYAPEHPEVSFVDVDNYTSAYQGTAYLTGLGHRRVAAIGGRPGAQESRDRLAGFHDALRDAGLPGGAVVEGDYSERSGYQAMQRLLEAPERPTAVFCMSDAMATGALLAIHEAGLAVPADVSVVGFDDLPASAYTMPPLTTLRQPIREMGGVASGYLIDLIEGRCRSQVRERRPAELVVRRSCAPPPPSAA